MRTPWSPDKHMPALTNGTTAPDFELPDQNGNLVRLSQFRGKCAVVLYFYPKDDTTGCTIEACKFRDDFARVPGNRRGDHRRKRRFDANLTPGLRRNTRCLSRSSATRAARPQAVRGEENPGPDSRARDVCNRSQRHRAPCLLIAIQPGAACGRSTCGDCALALTAASQPFRSRNASSISRRASWDTGTNGSRGGPP